MGNNDIGIVDALVQIGSFVGIGQEIIEFLWDLWESAEEKVEEYCTICMTYWEFLNALIEIGIMLYVVGLVTDDINYVCISIIVLMGLGCCVGACCLNMDVLISGTELVKCLN